jgi:ParB/RepB/Spo0J family partition protein
MIDVKSKGELEELLEWYSCPPRRVDDEYPEAFEEQIRPALLEGCKDHDIEIPHWLASEPVKLRKPRRPARLEKAKRGEMVPGHKYVERKGHSGEYLYIYPGQRKGGRRPKRTEPAAKEPKGEYHYTHESEERTAQFGEVAEIPTELIIRNPNQPRKTFDPQKLEELKTSILTHGLRNPVKLRPHPTEKGKFEIVSGERRVRAHRLGGLQTVRAIVEEMTTEEAAEESLLENIAREDLNPVEEGEAYAHMVSRGWTVQKLAQTVGKSTTYIVSMSRLATLIPEAKTLLVSKQLALTNALRIAALENEDLQRNAMRRVAKGDLSTQEFAIYVETLKANQELLPLFGGKLDEATNALPEGVTKKKARSIGRRYNEIINRVAGLLRQTINAKDYSVYPRVLRQDLAKRIDQLDVIETAIRRIKRDLIAEQQRRQMIERAKAAERMRRRHANRKEAAGAELSKSIQERRDAKAHEWADEFLGRVQKARRVLRRLLRAIEREGL